jgi:hypothetical protein
MPSAYLDAAAYQHAFPTQPYYFTFQQPMVPPVMAYQGSPPPPSSSSSNKSSPQRSPMTMTNMSIFVPLEPMMQDATVYSETQNLKNQGNDEADEEDDDDEGPLEDGAWILEESLPLRFTTSSITKNDEDGKKLASSI